MLMLRGASRLRQLLAPLGGGGAGRVYVTGAARSVRGYAVPAGGATPTMAGAYCESTEVGRGLGFFTSWMG